MDTKIVGKDFQDIRYHGVVSNEGKGSMGNILVVGISDSG